MNKNQNANSIVKKENGKETDLVSGFQGYFSFLSNDYPAWVYLDGLGFPSVATAFQAARTDDQKIRHKIANVSDIEQFRKIAMSIQNPKDWAQKKQKVMANLVRDKFKRNKEILDKLMSTKEKKLINIMKNEGYNEEYWGVYDGKGKNVLGKILMGIRQQFLKGLDTKQWIENNLNIQSDIKMCPMVSMMVLKDGKKIQKLSFFQNKNYYLFGSLKTADFNLQNPTISRNHACLYFSQLQVMIVDLNSTHGTFIKRKGEQQKQQLEGLIGYRLYKDDIIQFGTSARQYMVEIDRSEIEKYIVEQQAKLKDGIKDIPVQFQNAEEYSKLSKEELKNMLGIQNQCLLIEDLKDVDGYQKLKEYFGKFQKVKNIRFKINSKTGRNEGNAIIYFDNPNAVTNLLKNKKQLLYKVRGIGQSQAQTILNKKDHQSKRKSPQKLNQRRDQGRSRSKSRSRDKNKKTRS